MNPEPAKASSIRLRFPAFDDLGDLKERDETTGKANKSQSWDADLQEAGSLQYYEFSFVMAV